MDQLLFRAPGRALPWSTLSARLIEAIGGDHAVSDVRDVRIDGRPWRHSEASIPAGALIEARCAGSRRVAPAPPDATWSVLVPAPPWRRGRLRTDEGSELDYRVASERDGVAELIVAPRGADTDAVLDALAVAGMPVLADPFRGGVLVGGGLRMRTASPDASGPDVAMPWWPTEPIAPESASRESSRRRRGRGRGAAGRDGAPRLPQWTVSRATARVVRAGHPWLMPDRETGPFDAWRPGTLVEAVAPGGDPVAVVRIEGPGPIAARVWSRPGERSVPDPDAVPVRVAAALARREKACARGSAVGERDGHPWTDALRLVHGEADGLPGIAVDRLGPILRVLVTSHGAAVALAEPVARALRRSRGGVVGPVEGIVVVLHLAGRIPGRHECVRWWRDERPGAAGVDDRSRLIVHECGLRFSVDPGLAEPERPRPGVGLFTDQRENRRRLAERARRGGRWLNLFAHTGAFSVALLAAGAEEVVSVDLSKPYLDWLDENLALNREAGVDDSRHRSVRRDGRRYLEALGAEERFAGIVLDPPTAAAAGRRYWSAKRDLPPLVGAALGQLEPGGVLLVSHNDRRARGDLADVVRAAATGHGVTLAGVSRADPGPDYPRLPGFREGNAFRGVIATRG